MMSKKVLVVFGTRPEAIKLAPVIQAIGQCNNFTAHVCVTAQHRELLDQVLDVFEIEPDVDLKLMRQDQALPNLTARAIESLSAYYNQLKPHMVLLQGDTTTVLCGALAAFYNKIPIGHVEAGLRTHNINSPYPEEMNRVLTSRLADYHYAPTETARSNLLSEGIEAGRILVTGNTVIDALHSVLDRVRKSPPNIKDLPKQLACNDTDQSIVLITGHRRENFGQRFESICQAIKSLARSFPQTAFIYPVHLNPNVREPVYRLLSHLSNVYLIEPLDYLEFVSLMDRCRIVLTDSGGIQEEAPSLGKPVLVMRNRTERPEAISSGTSKLCGTNAEDIVSGVTNLLTNQEAYAAMANEVNPYGDGKAANRILEHLIDVL